MTAGRPSISLVTPSLNQGRFIRDTIESVLSQDYPGLEYLVQDGLSTDETLEILESFAGRVPYVSERDSGQASAINRGLRRTTGDVLGYLNSDDLLLPGALRAVGDEFARDPDIVLVFGGGIYIDATGATIRSCTTFPDAFSRLADGCAVVQPAAFFRRRVWEEIGEFDEDFHHVLDYDYWFRIAERYGPGRVRYLDVPLGASRLHADAKTVSRWGRALDEIFLLVKRRTGYVSIWWCIAKWNFRTRGEGQVMDTAAVPRLAYILALLEFLIRSPVRFWPLGLEVARHGVHRRVIARMNRLRALASMRR